MSTDLNSVKALALRSVTAPTGRSVTSPSTWSGNKRHASGGRIAATAGVAAGTALVVSPQGRKAVKGFWRAMKAQFRAPKKVAQLEASAQIAAGQRADLEMRTAVLAEDIHRNATHIGETLDAVGRNVERLGQLKEHSAAIDANEAKLELLGINSSAKLVQHKLDEARRLSYADAIANGKTEEEAQQDAATEVAHMARTQRKEFVTNNVNITFP